MLNFREALALSRVSSAFSVGFKGEVNFTFDMSVILISSSSSQNSATSLNSIAPGIMGLSLKWPSVHLWLVS